MLRVARSMMRWRVFSLLLLLFLSAPAWARSWSIANYTDTIVIDEDGSAVVIERITAVFVGSFNGIIRRIPVDYPGPHGSNYTLFLDVLQVQDSEGRDLKYQLSTASGERKVKIFVPGATDARREIVITYRVRNPIRYFDSYDEFYWNVTGNDWEVPIQAASANVTLPQKAADAGLRAQAYTGVYGSVEREAEARIDGAKAYFETTNPLPMRGGLTIDIYIPKGILKAPGPFTRLAWFLESNPVLLVPLFTFVVMFTVWRFKGRDPDPGISVAALYEPPKDLTPAECGALIDDRVDPRDITSTIVDLAVRGYLRIEEKSEKELLIFTRKDYVFYLMKPKAQWSGLTAFEQTMLDNIFQQGEVTSLSSLRNRFFAVLPSIRRDILSALKQKGMYNTDPESARGWALLAVALVVVPLVLLQYFGWANFFLSGWIALAAIAVSVAIIIFFAHIMPARSLRGARTRVAVRGFEEFMNRVDGDRLRTMPPDTFEKYLPFAMALGVEEHWAKAFAGIIQNPPSWYVSADRTMFNSIYFTYNLRAMSTTAGETFASAPRSSSSGSGFSSGGGFSGGGFSGGGFGGGGGSAF
jgi:uncharacterized membrane protein